MWELGLTFNPASCPLIVLKNVEQPLPGRPRTSSISPDLTTPSNWLSIVFSGCLPKLKYFLKLSGDVRTEATVAWMFLPPEADPDTSRSLNANVARRYFSFVLSAVRKVTFTHSLAS